MTTVTIAPTSIEISGRRYLSEDDLYTALVDRDRTLDGRVYFAIKSTGVYCRPGCPARRPLRKNVRYFLSPDAAERSGFRACRRCHPREVARDPRMLIVERACVDIDLHTDEDCSLTAVAARIGSSPHHLQRTFKEMLGVSPRAYLDARRIERVKQSLRNGDEVTVALYDAGYGSSSRLYERANAALGMTPGAYRAGGEHSTIRHLVSKTPLGWLLVASTDVGICAVRLGDEPDALIESLRDEFPLAEFVQGDDELHHAIKQILDSLEGRLPHGNFPLDVRSTAFQRRVWEELQRIPAGETRTYTEIAAAIGNPAAVRAVANACANNPVALIVPCHRVMRSDGSLGGYRWGIERKAELLRREKLSASIARA